MIIKTFTADSTAVALKDVRAEMGGDAVVLKTRQMPDGSGRVEITACLDKPTASQATATLTGSNSINTQTVSRRPVVPNQASENARPIADVGAEIERRLDLIDRKVDRLMTVRFENSMETADAADMRRLLIRAGLTGSIANELLSEAVSGDASDFVEKVRKSLVERIESVLAGKIKFNPGDKVFFYGPAGSGKTSLLGRIAAQLVVEDQKKVKLLSLDSCKVGGAEEIQSYGDLLSTEVIDPASSDRHNQSASEIILIDSPSITYDGVRFENVKQQVDQLKPNHRLVVCSALHNLEDNLRFMRRTESFQPTHLAVTMLDMTERWGTVLSLCEESSLKIALVTDSPGGIGMARTPNAEQLVTKIMNTEDSNVQA